MSTPIEVLILQLTADIGQYNQSVQKIIGLNREAAATVSSLKNLVTNLFAGYTASRFISEIQSSIKEISFLQVTAEKLNVSTNFLIVLQNQAKYAYVDMAALSLGIQRLERNIAEAALGSERLQRDLHLAGLSAEELGKMSVQQQYLAVANAIKNIRDEGTKNLVTMELFGRGGLRLLATLNEGKEGFAAAEQEAKKFGLTLSDHDVETMRAADISTMRLGQALKGLATQFGAELAPSIIKATKALTDFITKASEKAGGPGEGGWRQNLNELLFSAFHPGKPAFGEDWLWGGKKPGLDASDVNKPGWKPTANQDSNRVSAEKIEIEHEHARSVQELAAKLRGDLAPGLIKGAEAAEKLGFSLNASQKELVNTAAQIGFFRKFTEELKVQYETFGMSADRAKLYKAELEGLVTPEQKAELTTRIWLVEQKKLNDEVGKFTQVLKDDIEAINSHDHQHTAAAQHFIREKEREGKALSDVQKKQVLATAERADAAEITKKFGDPHEKFVKEQQYLQELLRKGEIDTKTYRKALLDLQHQFAKGLHWGGITGVETGTADFLALITTPQLMEEGTSKTPKGKKSKTPSSSGSHSWMPTSPTEGLGDFNLSAGFKPASDVEHVAGGTGKYRNGWGPVTPEWNLPPQEQFEKMSDRLLTEIDKSLKELNKKVAGKHAPTTKVASGEPF